MRKKGFTLAEVLITLTVVGVIAALVIPQFVTDAHNRANASKLSTIASEYENVFGMMMLKENANSIFDTGFGSAYTSSTVDTAGMTDALRLYTKIARTSTLTSDLGYLSYLPLNPFIPAAMALDEEACQEDVCSNPNCDGYDEYYCSHNHCASGHYYAGQGEDSDFCCSGLGGYYTYGADGSCIPIDDYCRNPGDPRYDGLNCKKHRCLEDRGMFVETEAGSFECKNVPQQQLPEPTGNNTVMYTINNELVKSSDFNFVLGASTQNGGNLFFQAPKSYETKDADGKVVTHIYSTVYIDVNGGSVPNKFGRDVFAFILSEEGHLYPYGSENAARAQNLSVSGNINTWKKAGNRIYSCVGPISKFDGLGCTARLVESNFKVEY